MVDPNEVRDRIAAALPGARVSLADSTGAGDHFEVHVIAAAFAGKSLLEQHRMVYGALGDLMARIHALALRTEAAGEDAA
jgi:stress-induced morphogen